MAEIKNLCQEKTVRKTCNTLVYVGHDKCILHTVEQKGELCDPYNTCSSCINVSSGSWAKQAELLRKKITALQRPKARKIDDPSNKVKLAACKKAFANIRAKFPLQKKRISKGKKMHTPEIDIPPSQVQNISTSKPGTKPPTIAQSNAEKPNGKNLPVQATYAESSITFDVEEEHEIPFPESDVSLLDAEEDTMTKIQSKNQPTNSNPSKPCTITKSPTPTSSKTLLKCGIGFKIVPPKEKIAVPKRKIHSTRYSTTTYLDTHKFSKNPYEEFVYPSISHNIPEESQLTDSLQERGIRIINPHELDAKTKLLVAHKKLSDTRTTLTKLHGLKTSVDSVDREIYSVNKQNNELKSQICQSVKAYTDLHEDIRYGKLDRARQDQINRLKFELNAAKSEIYEKDKEIAILKIRLAACGEHPDASPSKRQRTKSTN